MTTPYAKSLLERIALAQGALCSLRDRLRFEGLEYADSVQHVIEILAGEETIDLSGIDRTTDARRFANAKHGWTRFICYRCRHEWSVEGYPTHSVCPECAWDTHNEEGLDSPCVD